MNTLESGTSLESAQPVDSTTPVIQEGCYAIVCRAGGEQSRVCKLSASTNVLIEKLRFEAESALGHPFGLFEVIGKRLVPAAIEDIIKRDGIVDIEIRDVEVENGGGDGEASASSSSAAAVTPSVAPIEPSAQQVETRQTVTEEEILEMRDTGSSASQLVNRLVEGSATFSARSDYSKNKYIRRKTRKHSDRVFILRPTIRLLADAYLRKDHDRAGCLRVDQLGQVLHLGSVHFGRRVAVFDQLLGIISAAIVERLGGQGACVHLHRSTIAQGIPCFHAMDFPPAVFSTFFPVRIASVLNGFKVPWVEEVKDESDVKVEEKSADENMNGDGKSRQRGCNGTGSEDTEPATTTMLAVARKADRTARENAGLAALRDGVDTLIIGSRSVEPTSVLESLWKCLRPGGAVVCYSANLQPLIRCQLWLRRQGVVNISINDQWHRKFQVLPGSTHPLMSQSVVGGYILAAIKVINPPATPT